MVTLPCESGTTLRIVMTVSESGVAHGTRESEVEPGSTNPVGAVNAESYID